MAFRKPAPQYDPRPGKDTSAESKDIASNSLAFLTHSMPSRHRSGSTASTRSNRSTHNSSEQQQQQQQQTQKAASNATSATSTPLNPTLVNSSNNHALLPPLLPRNSSDNNSIHSSSSKQSHHHIRLPSFFRRRKHSSASATSASLESPSPPSSSVQLSLQQHTIVMVPTHDIHITWPHPVPSGKAFIAGTWSVPGHRPWEKLQMTRIPGTDSFEIHLDVQEIEDISDYLDEDGYLHHELLDHHHPHDHSHQHQSSSSNSPLPTPTSTTTHLSRRKRISRFFGRARSSSSASTTSTTSSNTKDQHIDLPYHHQSKDGTFLPLAREYRYQYKFVIDDEWKCDHDQRQVQDPHGHWNHELVVELVEQLPAGSSAEGRSRSSSLQSQHGPQLAAELSSPPNNKPLPIPHPTIIATSTSTSDSTTTKSTTTSIIVSPAEEDEDELAREDKVTEKNVDAVSAPVPASSSTLAASAASATPTAIPISTTNIKKGSHKSRDTYEAVLIFDETDDLSDGEEGRSKRHQVIESDDDEDEKLEDNKNSSSNNNNENNATEEGNVLLGVDVDVVKAEVTPQQDNHASLSPGDQQENCPSPVVIKVSAANAADDVTATLVSSLVDEAEVSSANAIETEEGAQTVEEQKEEKKVEKVEVEDVSAAIEDVFVNSSSVLESLPQLDEPTIIVPAESSSTAEEEEVTPAPIVETVKVEPEVVEAEKVTVAERPLEVEEETPVPAPIASSLAPASIAIPASPVFSIESVAAQSHLLSPDVEPEAFVLQAAVNFDEEDSGNDNGDVSEVEEHESSPSSSHDVKPTAATATKTVVLEVITDASVIAAAAAATVAVGSAATTANDYSQVPSPPLTPSNLTSSKCDLISSEQIVSEAEIKTEKQNEETFERSVYMTPRAESTFSEHTTLEETSTTTTTSTEESSATATVVEDENVTIDILDDKDLPTYLLSSSSSSSSLSTLTGGHSSRRSSNSSNSSTITKATSSSHHREVVEHDKEHSKKSGPEQHPNLFWSFCKTTAVVSAAVVILGLGLGRRRD